MKVFLINLGLALLWMFLGAKPSFASFLVGFGLGFLLVAAGRQLFPESRYVERVVGFARFAGALLRELVVSNWMMIVVILFRRRDRIHAGYLTYDVRGLTPWEVWLLSVCITLTPGTTMVELTPDGGELVLHALDAGDPEAVRRSIDRGLRDPILGWTRV
jgi:multicomponent Na+:H+ antiporter subunit E